MAPGTLVWMSEQTGALHAISGCHTTAQCSSIGSVQADSCIMKRLPMLLLYHDIAPKHLQPDAVNPHAKMSRLQHLFCQGRHTSCF